MANSKGERGQLCLIECFSLNDGVNFPSTSTLAIALVRSTWMALVKKVPRRRSLIACRIDPTPYDRKLCQINLHKTCILVYFLC